MMTQMLKRARWIPWMVVVAVALWGYFANRSRGPQYMPQSPRIVGYGRDDIRKATDATAEKVDRTPKEKSIADLLALKRPAELPPDGNPTKFMTRYTPGETTLWRVRATLISVVLREDRDVYLVLDQGGYAMVAEAPDPEECKTSVFRRQIEDVRRRLESRFAVSAKPQNVAVPVEIVGLGFFGKPGLDGHGGRTTGFRLSPILGFQEIDKKQEGP